MSDDPVRTRVHTDEGELAFQDYFVRLRCAPQSRRSASRRSSRAARRRRRSPPWARSPEAIILCPSNPYLSIDPILAVPGMRALLRAAGAPVIAVSPLVAGDAVKGPTAKIMRELGVPLTPAAIARHYAGAHRRPGLDRRDAAAAGEIDCHVKVTDTLMNSLADREYLAREVLAFAAVLARCAPVSTWALVPVKARHAGKQRLRGGAWRTRSARSWCAACSMTCSPRSAAAPQIDGTLVMSPERDALALATPLLHDPAAEHECGADPGLAALAQRGATCVAIIAADLPLLAPAEVADLVTAARSTAVALAPDARGTGTNAVCLTLPTRLPPALWPGEFRAAPGRGRTPRHRRRSRSPAPGLGFDVDEAADLAALQARGLERYGFLR